MLIRKAADIRPSEITDKDLYANRRRFMQGAAAAALAVDEFGTDKYSPAQRAKSLRTRRWTVKVSGEVKRPKTFDIDELIELAPL